MNYLGLRSAIRWNLCLSTLDWTNEQLLANCFTITCYSAISLFNISLTSCFYSSFTQIIQENILRIFSILCCKSLSFNDLFDSSWHWLNQSLNNFNWKFSSLLTNQSLQVRKSFWWRASFTNCLLQDHPQILYWVVLAILGNDFFSMDWCVVILQNSGFAPALSFCNWS